VSANDDVKHLLEQLLAGDEPTTDDRPATARAVPGFNLAAAEASDIVRSTFSNPNTF
jgi:hypothetical protein